ncbi:hypothetical protein SNEBB_008827 [Seison nebaliae]|nr:hypothetical protein SNEBB_008827 [Seison nebaliae]
MDDDELNGELHLEVIHKKEEPFQLSFFYGNRVVEIIHGILYLSPVVNTYQVCAMNVPSTIAICDIWHIVSCHSDIMLNFQIIRTEESNCYLIIFSFINKEKAEYFVDYLEGKTYTDFEQRIWSFYGIDKIEVGHVTSDKPTNCSICLESLDYHHFEDIVSQLKRTSISSMSLSNDENKLRIMSISSLSNKSPSTTAIVPSITSEVATPEIKIVSEQMNENEEKQTKFITSTTILCNHTFHSHCLTKWQDFSCPVCRYHQVPEWTDTNRCVSCGLTSDLWICLICGHIGCSRYQYGHSIQHFFRTQHTYVLQIGDSFNRVWDYAGDNYVHRLIRNNVDGKIIEVTDESREQLTSARRRCLSQPPHPNIMRDAGICRTTTNSEFSTTTPMSHKHNGRTDQLMQFNTSNIGNTNTNSLNNIYETKKLDELALEYTFMFTNEMEKQRDYFNDELKSYRRLVKDQLILHDDILKENIKIKNEKQVTIDDQKNKIRIINQQLEEKDKKIKKITDQLKDLKFLKDQQQKATEKFNKQIQSERKKSEEEILFLKNKMRDLEETVRDLTFFVESRDKLQQIDQEELKESHVIVAEPKVPLSSASLRKNRNKKR